MKKLLFLSACVGALLTEPVLARVSEPEIIIVKVLESRLATRIVIARSWGIPEEVEITPGLTGNEATVEVEAAKKMQQVLAKLYQQGYSIKSTFSGERGLSTLVLVKEQ
jgi:hypothetical protein